jgi:NAD-dependent DNA ligase
MEKQIKKYQADPLTFIENATDDQISKIILYASKKYYNEDSVISDDEFDFLVDELKKRDPKHPTLSKIGAPLPKVTEIKKVKLPYHMGSMDKYKLSDIKQFDKWLSKYQGPYTISDKLDGVSALYYWDDGTAHLYKRGDDQMGSDISFLIPYIPSLSKLKINKQDEKLFAIRGELIISLDNYESYTGDKTNHKDTPKPQSKDGSSSNPRSTVAGLTNKKTIDPETVKLIDFVAYEMLYPREIHTEQLKEISKLGFITVHHGLLKTIDFPKLIDILQDRKKTGKYECDGIIITDNNQHNVNKSGNPEHAFAFKELPDKLTTECKVIEVEWNVSKDGYIKPTVLIEPVQLSGVTIKRATGFNGRFIKDNKIGPGSIIQIVRAGDVIPHIEKVIKATGESMPDFPYKWNDTNVDILLDETKNKNKDITREHKISELTYFVTHMNMKFLSEQTVGKLYDEGFDTIIKILTITKEDLLKLDNFKETMANKIYETIQNSIKDLDILIFAHASNIFGHNFGSRRLKKIFEIFPKVLIWIKNKSFEEIKNAIKEIEGFEDSLSGQFAEKIIEFDKLVNKLPSNIKSKVQEYKTEEVIEDKKISGKTFVFSDFRNKEWEAYIELHGGKISSSISSKTDYLVTTKEAIDAGTNSKVKKAIELKVEIVNKDNFIKKFM